MKTDRIEFIKNNYPKGTRIKLDRMDDPYHPVPEDTTGTVEHVDDIGTIHMKWDNGQSLGLVPGEDSFHVIERPETYEEKIRVVVVRPGEKPSTEYIDNTLKGQQRVVEGLIEEVYIEDAAVLVCNEEGKIQNLKANRHVNNDIIAGTFFIARDNGSEHLSSLTDDQIDHFMNEYGEIEDITQEEMLEKSGFIIRGF